jgi:ferredoxin-NADP reductase
MTERLRLRVAATHRITDNIHHVAIERLDGQMPDYRAGQYVDFHFLHDGKPTRRSYSIATARPAQGGVTRWEFYVGLVEGGAGSRYLTGLRVGDLVEVGPPSGVFTLKNLQPQRLVLVATSTGVAPFRAMGPELEALLERQVPVSLVFGCRHAGQMLFTEEWYQWLERYETFEFVPCFSRPTQADESRRFGGLTGRVQLALERLPLISSSATYMLCGNPDMVDEVERLLIDRGINPYNIVVESFETGNESTSR